MNWNVGQARDNLADVINQLSNGPQKIYRHSTLAAVVIAPEEYETFSQWRAQAKPSITNALQSLQTICAEEGYTLETPPRVDRANQFGAPDAD